MCVCTMCVCPKECACVITNSFAKQCDWLSHGRPALLPFPLFLFPANIPYIWGDKFRTWGMGMGNNICFLKKYNPGNKYDMLEI